MEQIMSDHVRTSVVLEKMRDKRGELYLTNDFVTYLKGLVESDERIIQAQARLIEDLRKAFDDLIADYKQHSIVMKGLKD